MDILINLFDPSLCSCHISKYQTQVKDSYREPFLMNYHHVNATWPHRRLFNIGIGNDLMPPGTKSLPDPMLTEIYFAYGTLRHNEWIATD